MTYANAREVYGELTVDTESVLDRLRQVSISLPCWQGDDVTGFEGLGTELGGGLAVTGSRPGRARTPNELRADLEQALALIPGHHRVNLHASYADPLPRSLPRNELHPDHFQNWIAWGRAQNVALDFNPTFFAHPLAQDGMTLSHSHESIRRFWIEHGIACRRIGASLGAVQGSPCITNLWIPDGSKEAPVDRVGPRQRLTESLDAILAEPFLASHLQDAVEAKLFGLGSESYVVGSHEFYLGYAITRQILLCLDAGHFHPTETLADKISAVLPYIPGLLLHFSRGVRWDSDHVVTLSDDLLATTQEIVRGDFLARTHLGLDFFDASIHRVAGWVIACRNVQKAILRALLEPIARLRQQESNGDFTARLAWGEELKSLPWQAVWKEFCERHEVPPGPGWIEPLARYEARTLAARSSRG